MFQVYNLSRENNQPENMCDIVFEKQKVTVRQQTERVFMQKDSKDSFKKCYEKFRRIRKKIFVPEFLSLIVINSVDLHFH